MTCAFCGASVPDAAKFCPACGKAADPSNAETVLGSSGAKAGADEAATRLVGSSGRTTPKPTSSGWLSSSGSIDHGRFAPGEMLDERYRVIGLLGRGGMGEVYRADDLRLGQSVALKFLPVDFGRDAGRLAQFHNEVRTARQVSHPNVCRVYDIGEVGGQLYLSMEYVDGEDLATSLRRIGRFPEDKAVDMARQLAAGLAAAHERGVLHRDLKPANIMLDGTGKVRIMDFSLAAAGEVTDVRAGTPAYMAPEQLKGLEVTKRSDIYALGLVLYELFTGKRAFGATTLPELMQQHETSEVTAPTEIVRTIDPTIERAILRCLDPDPARRPSSALAVSAALPGGDPLAAALAAGETPSPEMVAAAGKETAALTAAQGVTLLALAGALLVGLAAVVDRTTVVSRVPMEKSRPVLIDRAEDLRRKLGYDRPVADRASGYYHDDALLGWAARRGWGVNRWAQLATVRPPAIGFWYRSSPSLLLPYDRSAAVSTGDPPLLSVGMFRVNLDPVGRLTLFRGVPSVRDKPLASSADWGPLFEAAQLDRSRFTETTPMTLPQVQADERIAWTGELPELPGAPIRVEAGAFRGRPTSFVVLGEWGLGDGGGAGSQPSVVVRTIGVLIVAGLPIGAAILARRNLKLGRSDRRGAFRTWAVAFGTGIAAWVIGPTHVNGLEEVDRMFATLGRLLFWSSVLYVVYLALEPYVRRTWPSILITWSRLVGGRVRDPLVGRDVLVGVLAGFFISLIPPAFVLLPGLFGYPQPALTRTQLAPLLGIREMLSMILSLVFNSVLNSMFVVLMFSLLRQGLRAIAARAPGVLGRVFNSDWAVAIVTLVVFIIVIKRNSVDPVYPKLDLVFTALIVACLLGVVLRFGLIALAVAFFVADVVGDAPLTLDSSKIYAGAVWFQMAIVMAIAVAGYWMARKS